MKSIRITLLRLLIVIPVLTIWSCKGDTQNPLQNIPLKAIQVTPDNLQLTVKDSRQIIAEAGPSDADSREMPFIWESDNIDVATVSSTGLVRALSPGNAEITVSARVTTQISKTIPVTVINITVPLTGITVTPENVSLAINESVQVTANPEPADATDISFVWESGDTDIATVSETGLITGIAEGRTTITLRSGDIEQEVTVSVHKPVKDTIRVLTIGNSFSVDAVENYLYELGQEEKITFVIGNLYISGCSLELHWENAKNNNAAYSYRKIKADGTRSTTPRTSLLQGVKDEQWDYISFQQNSAHSGLIETYSPYLNQLTNYVKEHATNPQVEFVFHQTWAYDRDSKLMAFSWYNNDQIQMYEAIVNASREAATESGINKIIPSGTAIQNGRGTFIGDNFSRDGMHLSLDLGRYTAACTWFESLTGKSVIGNTFAPETLSSLEVITVQHAAHEAVLSPFETTEINVDK